MNWNVRNDDEIEIIFHTTIISPQSADIFTYPLWLCSAFLVAQIIGTLNQDTSYEVLKIKHTFRAEEHIMCVMESLDKIQPTTCVFLIKCMYC